MAIAAEPKQQEASLPADEAGRLAALRRYNIVDTPTEPVYDDLTQIAADVCQTPIAVVTLVESSRQFFKAEIGLGVRETPIDVSICAHAILQPDLFIVPDLREDPRFAGNPLVAGDPYLRFYAGALLQTEEGYPIGTMCVLDYKPRELDERQKKTLRALARQAMNLMELRRANAAQGRMLIELDQAAAEKAVLLEELQHRVKNNVQMMSALVQLQGRREAAPAARAALEKLRRRLEALVLLNSQFAGADKADRVDLAAYLGQLCRNLATFNDGGDKGVALDLDLDRVEVGTHLALRLGMIANEFITNSFKHAFATGRGRLTVSLEAGDFGTRLTLSDNGPGMPASVREDGLGLQIMPALARQIRATIDWPTGNGTTLVVTWPGTEQPKARRKASDPEGPGVWCGRGLRHLAPGSCQT